MRRLCYVLSFLVWVVLTARACAMLLEVMR